ncbi:hypothetical protein LTR17_003187 [Elasticomyces elasticus]|nr:hypothetical protein LTR17_003187 [Elasticomyces elasticus]
MPPKLQRPVSNRLDADGGPKRLTKRKEPEPPLSARPEPKLPRPTVLKEQSANVPTTSRKEPPKADQASSVPHQALSFPQQEQQGSRVMGHHSYNLSAQPRRASTNATNDQAPVQRDRDQYMPVHRASTTGGTRLSAPEDNLLHTQEIRGREQPDDDESVQDEESDTEAYERVAPFRHALMQHLTSSDSNPYSIDQLANNPTLLVDLVQSFIEQKSKVVYDCFMAQDNDDDGYKAQFSDSDAGIVVASMLVDRPWSVDFFGKEVELKLTTVLCPTCPVSRIYADPISLKDHYKKKHLGWDTGMDVETWDEAEDFEALGPLLEGGTFTYAWKSKHGLMDKEELLDWIDDQPAAAGKVVKTAVQKAPNPDLAQAYTLLQALKVDKLLPRAKEITGKTPTSTLRVQCGFWDDEGTKQPAWMYLRKDANGKVGTTTVAFELNARGGKRGKNSVRTFFSGKTSDSVECEWFHYLDPELWFPTSGVYGPSHPEKKKAFEKWRIFLRDVYMLYAPEEADKLADNAGG